ncbi:hypothetical protein ZWY2020_032834 [Hordeum vulgare]|nr:hypothetical protein ZWY2020_032834 [Hordeum vulgare]
MLADLLRAVLHRLPPTDVARTACVCRLWRVIASDRAVLEAAFRAHPRRPGHQGLLARRIPRFKAQDTSHGTSPRQLKYFVQMP